MAIEERLFHRVTVLSREFLGQSVHLLFQVSLVLPLFFDEVLLELSHFLRGEGVVPTTDGSVDLVRHRVTVGPSPILVRVFFLPELY